MGLETFSLNMSQEACHFFSGLALGGMIVPKVMTWLFVLYFISKLIKPTLEMWGIKLRDLIIKPKIKIKK